MTLSVTGTVNNSDTMKAMVTMTVNAMAGFVYARGMPGMTSTVEMDGMKVTYTFNVPSTIGPEKIKASLEAHSDSKINEMLAMHIGACADYTVTVATSPVTTMGNTMDSAGNQVTASTASPATTGGSEAAATTVDAHDGHDHDDHDG